MSLLSPKLDWHLANPLWAQSLNPVISSVDTLVAMPLLNGAQINTIVLTATTPKAITHLLGHIPNGFIVVDNMASSIIWRTAWTQQTITLESSANTTISIWVY